MASDPSYWVGVDHYLAIHDATLREFEHFIEHNTIVIKNATSEEISLRGRLLCAEGVYLQVSVRFDLDERNRLRVTRYTFHAGIAKDDDRPIFRYDNAHVYMREGHPDPHHKHRFDVTTGKEIVPPEWIGEAHQPTLRSVLAELERWWFDIGHTLGFSSDPPIRIRRSGRRSCSASNSANRTPKPPPRRR